MKDTLYRRRLVERKKGLYSQDYISPVQEAKWFQPPYNRSKQLVTTAYGSYYLNEKLLDSKPISQPHGDFKSDYPYLRIRTFNEGNAFVGGRVDVTSQTGQVYSYTVRTSSTVRDAVRMRGDSSTVPVFDSLKSDAMSALSAKIIDGFPSWDITTDLAEMSSTLDFVKDGARRAVDIVAGCLTRNPKRVLRGFGVPARRSDRRRVRRTIDHYRKVTGHYGEAATRSAADLWLAYRYGFMPLLYSAEDAIFAAFTPSASLKRSHQVTFKGKLTLTNSTVTSDGVGSTGSYLKVDVKTLRELTYSYRLRADVEYRDSLMARLGLNPWTIPKTMWELVPFSFVIDWFYDVGSWFDRLNLRNLVSSISILGTLKDTCVETKSLLNLRATPSSLKSVFVPIITAGSVQQSTCRSFQRELVPLSVSPPRLEWGLDKWKRQLDSISLAIGFIRKPTLKGIPQ